MYDAGAVLLEHRDSRNVFHGKHGSIFRLDRAASVHVGVHISRNSSSTVAGPDHLERAQHGAAMIPMPVREHDAIHGAHVEPEAFDVLLENRCLGAGIEEE